MPDPNELQQALDGLRVATAEAVNIKVDMIRRQALYPDLTAMEVQTAKIRLAAASTPINEVNKDIDHLLHHIDMLNKELRKMTAEKLRNSVTIQSK